MTITTGGDVVLHYLWEDAGFRQSPDDSTHKTFGAEPRLQTAEGSNNAVEVMQPGSKTAADIIEQLFDGAWAVQFTYTNPWWLRSVFGPPSTSGTDTSGDGTNDQWTHTYTVGEPSSFQIIEGYLGAGEDRVLEGCVTSEVSVDLSVNQNAQVTIRGAYASEQIDDTGNAKSSQKATDYRAMTFAQAEVHEGGDVKSDVIQSAELTLSPNTTLIPGLGSRFPVDYSDKELTTQLNLQKYKEGDTANAQAMYGGSLATSETVENTVTMNAILDNGETGTSINKADVELSGTFPDSYGESGATDPTSDLEESLNHPVMTPKVTATNTTETPP